MAGNGWGEGMRRVVLRVAGKPGLGESRARAEVEDSGVEWHHGGLWEREPFCQHPGL